MDTSNGDAQTVQVAVYLKEAAAPYRERLVDGDGVSFVFCSTESELRQAMAHADILLCSSPPPPDAVCAASSLRWIQAAAAGVDALHAVGLPPDGVALTRIAEGFGEPIAEYVLGHLLAIAQRVEAVHRHQAERAWVPFEAELLGGQTMGVAGVGAVGKVVAERGAAMGMRTVGLARSPGELALFEHVYGEDQLEAFLSELDVLVLCLPLTPRTRHLIGPRELGMLKRSCILVNVARGAVIDEAALIDALDRGRIRAAVLDVFEQEPLPADSPLWSMDNVTITPHHSGLNRPAMIAEFFLDNLARYRSGRPLRGVVQASRGY